jgi:hypothetical protein
MLQYFGNRFVYSHLAYYVKKFLLLLKEGRVMLIGYKKSPSLRSREGDRGGEFMGIWNKGGESYFYREQKIRNLVPQSDSIFKSIYPV